MDTSSSDTRRNQAVAVGSLPYLAAELIQQIISYLDTEDDFLNLTGTCRALYEFHESRTWALYLLNKYGKRNVLGEREVYLGRLVRPRLTQALSKDSCGTGLNEEADGFQAVRYRPHRFNRGLGSTDNIKPWWQSCRRSHPSQRIKVEEVVRYLIYSGANPRQPTEFNAIVWAAAAGETDLVAYLLTNHDPNAFPFIPQDPSDWDLVGANAQSPLRKALAQRVPKDTLYAACVNGHADIAWLCFDAAPLEILSRHTEICDSFAAAGANGHVKVVKALLDILVLAVTTPATAAIATRQRKVVPEADEDPVPASLWTFVMRDPPPRDPSQTSSDDNKDGGSAADDYGSSSDLVVHRGFLLRGVLQSAIVDGINEAAENAAEQGHLNVIRTIASIRGMVDPFPASRKAVQNGHASIVRLFADGGHCDEGQMYTAAVSGSLEIVKIIVGAGGDLSCGLQAAAGAGHMHIVQYFLELNAEKEGGCLNLEDAIHSAARGKHFDLLKPLFDAATKVNKNDRIALVAACEHGEPRHVKICLQAGINPRVNDNEPLRKACARGHKEIVEMLIEAGANPSAINIITPARYLLFEYHNRHRRVPGDANGPLISAVVNNRADIVRLLLGRGIPQTVQNKALRSALRAPTNREIVQILVDEGKAAVTGPSGEMALEMAAYLDDFELVEFLLSRGRDVRRRRNLVFVAACKFGSKDVMNGLLNSGDDININFENGHPLRWAADQGRLDIVNRLLDAGADVHANGDQALLWAASKNMFVVIQRLLEAGSNIPHEAWLLAARRRHNDLLKIYFDHCGGPDHFLETKKGFRAWVEERSRPSESLHQSYGAWILEIEANKAQRGSRFWGWFSFNPFDRLIRQPKSERRRERGSEIQIGAWTIS
ncbi:Transient receptor putative cation channel sub A member 1 [Quaeritorhiza haematococci]|nr:Transient receptor putative cation channel sub A member 1 [Quaeritorhiza haematococci]